MTTTQTAQAVNHEPDARVLVDDWIGELVEVQARKKSLTEREDQLKDALRAVVDDRWTAASGLTVQVTHRKQVTQAVAKQVLDADTYQQCFAAKFDAPTVRRLLSPEDYDRYAVTIGKASVQVID